MGSHCRNMTHNAHSQKIVVCNPICMQLACRYLQYRNGKMSRGCQFNTTDTILFIVNFHYFNYTPVHFIEHRSFIEFSKRFKYSVDLIFVGAVESEAIGVYGTGVPIMGFYSYRSYMNAYDLFNSRQGFNYYGFMFLNDDSCLNPWVLNTLPFNVSYYERIGELYESNRWKFTSYKNTFGITNFEAVTLALEELNRYDVHSGPYHVTTQPYWGRGDFFYVYRRHSQFVRDILQTMYEYRVFLEIAVPTAVAMVNGSGIPNCNHIGRLFVRTCAHIHPTKFSNMLMRQKCINRIINSTFYWD